MTEHNAPHEDDYGSPLIWSVGECDSCMEYRLCRSVEVGDDVRAFLCTNCAPLNRASRPDTAATT